jgi:hypothetical protein
LRGERREVHWVMVRRERGWSMYNNSHEREAGNRTYCKTIKGLVYESVSLNLFTNKLKVGNGNGTGV